MYILGINAYHSDASAALLKDGVLVAAIEEERFTRIKHWSDFPANAIRFCLNEAGISLNQVDHIAIGRDPKAKLLNKLKFVAQYPAIGLKAINERLSNRRKISGLDQVFHEHFPGIDQHELKHKIHHIEHHRAHLASAFYASPYDEAALFSIDGSGDFTTTMIGIGKGHQMEILDSVDFPHSIGIMYTAFTQFLGFPHYGDEYKVMGLAPYGEPKFLDKIRGMVKFKSNGLFEMDQDFFTTTKGTILKYTPVHLPSVSTLYTEKWFSLLGRPRQANEELTQYHKDLAATVQHFTEEIIFHLLNALYEKTKLASVCIAGGVAQNSVANGKISRNTPFQNVYIPSAGHDAGISMGAALYTHHQLLDQTLRHPIHHAYWGSHFTNDQIQDLLNARNIPFVIMEDEALYNYASDRIIEGAVMGWFNGKAEFGPRALGGRSILIDPRRSDAKALLNAKIKRRESFRPFAPSILEEFVDDFFEVHDKVPFMEKVFPIRKEKQELIPAVTHVDGTGRLQTVNKNNNHRYYQLIKRFHEKTGIPILLNTSFNENEPIVNAPAEALDCFLRTEMDILIMENIIVERDML
jgi:carbamoyltransferase